MPCTKGQEREGSGSLAITVSWLEGCGAVTVLVLAKFTRSPAFRGFFAFGRKFVAKAGRAGPAGSTQGPHRRRRGRQPTAGAWYRRCRACRAWWRLRRKPNVVNIDGFFRFDFAGAQSFAVDERIGFAGADAVGIDAHGEKSEERKTRFFVIHVNGIGVGEQSELVTPGQAGEKFLGLDGDGIKSGVPSVHELIEGKRTAEALGEMGMPIARRDAAFLPIEPVRVFLQRH